jgi:hypothetical protein
MANYNISGPELTANSSITLSTSSAETRDSLTSFIRRLAANGDPQAQVDRDTGHFVSVVGNARVVWKLENNKILVISIYIP